MIVFDLCCAQGEHIFEAWFSSSAAFADQQARHLLICPVCGDQEISKAVMAPSIAAKGNRKSDAQPVTDLVPVAKNADPAIEMKKLIAKIAALQAETIKSSQWVGKDFEKKARAMDAGDMEQASIHGQATPEQAQAMVDDGIGIMPLLIPVVPPEELN